MRATDWSLGGLRLDGFPEQLPNAGDELAIQLHLPFQGFDVSFDVKAEVVRADPEKAGLSVKFTEVGDRERELMSHFIEELVRGSMSNAEDTIQRIDVPVTPASLKPDASPVEQLPVRRMPVKTIAMTGIYAALGLIIFGYTGLLMYTNVYQLEVQTAVLNAPVQPVRAQVDGQVVSIAAKEGATVKQGEVLIDVLDNKLEREIELANIAVGEQKAKLAFLKQRYTSELDKVQGFATVEMKNVRQTRVDLESLEAQLLAAKRKHARFQILYKKGYLTETKLEEAEKEVIKLQQAVESRKIELKSRAKLADSNFGRRLYTGDRIIGDVEEIEARVKLAANEIELSRKRHQALLRQRSRMVIKAPFEGRVVSLPVGEFGFVRSGDVVAIVEKQNARTVLAYLTQDEVMKIGMGDEARLFIPALARSLKGRVVSIDRTAGFVREQDIRKAPGYSWRGPGDRTAKVMIELIDQQSDPISDGFRPGLPVVVVFPQRSTNSLLASISRRLALFN